MPPTIYIAKLLLVLLLNYFTVCNTFIQVRSTKPRKSVVVPHSKPVLSYHLPYPVSSSRIRAVTEPFDQSSSILQQKQKSLWISRASLLTVSAFYGTNFGCVKILGDSLDPSVAAALRFSLAAIVFLPYILKLNVLADKRAQRVLIGGLEVGLYNAVGYWAQAISLRTTSASTVAFICSLAVIVVPMLDMLFGNKNKSEASQSVAPLFPALLATCGVACLELGGLQAPGMGDLWAFLQPLFFGLSFWRIEKHIKHASDPGASQAFTGAMMLSVALFSICWSLQEFVFPVLNSGGLNAAQAALASQFSAFSDWHVVAAIAWTGVVTTALTAFVENSAMKSLSAAESTVIYSTEPLWGAAFATVMLGEHLGWNTALGAALIVAACLWSTLGSVVFAALAPGLLAAQTEVIDAVEEVVENSGMNLNQLLDSLWESNRLD